MRKHEVGATIIASWESDTLPPTPLVKKKRTVRCPRESTVGHKRNILSEASTDKRSTFVVVVEQVEAQKVSTKNAPMYQHTRAPVYIFHYQD